MGDKFITKDSGERLVFDSGMQRDVETGKKDYSLCVAGPMFERWAALLTRGAEKYERNNWMKARGNAEEERFMRSAFRHFIQWVNGEKDEDHAAAVFFNINGVEYVRSQRYDEGQPDAHEVIVKQAIAVEEIRKGDAVSVDGMVTKPRSALERRQLETAFLDGSRCALAGRNRTDNPYRPVGHGESRCYQAWLEGFDAATGYNTEPEPTQRCPNGYR